ncbi:autotransporter family protein [Fusobacterium ulcerans]|uniref:autotransporter family protein n=1 Tax=Fusobacterium ulcerans TaxID=861 RepID=UPI0027B9C634|nr:autotransporter outer membrane beta-barrel domain-containing protein [Fusobacterium ulcerans]
MIEKIMKAVKSGNKKRGRNITVGAVIGFLLSCTAVMGADDKYLWIRENSGAIEFNISKTNNSNGNDGDWKEEHPYNDENTWNADTETYINNMTLSSNENNGKRNEGFGDFDLSYGLRLSGTLTEFNFINNGSITATTYSTSSGIDNVGTIGNITNNGSITAKSSGTSSSGIDNYGTIGNVTNNGSITAEGQYGSFGIFNIGTMKNITNNGSMTGGRTSSSTSYGIYNTSGNKMENITNTGIIYGKTNAVKNSGTIGSFNNYGLLISGSTNVVDGISIEAYSDAGGQNKINNYGLAFTADGSGSYENHGASDANHNFGKTWDAAIDGVAYNIRNVEADVNSTGGAITNIKSFKIEGGELYSDTTKINDSNSTSNVILNGITDTLLVSTGDTNQLDNSVINAYGTAVEFDGTNGGKLTLSRTTVNGGVKTNTAAILGSDDSSKTDTLVLENSVVNGSIDMQGGNDELTIGAGSIVNGKLDGGDDDDTLTFGTNSVASPASITKNNTKDSINISHDIAGFENINVGTKVTFASDLSITGANNIALEKDGVLLLTLDKNDLDSGKIIGHALYNLGSTTVSSTGGKILLDLDGANGTEIISFGDTNLENSIVPGDNETLDITSKVHTIKAGANPNEVVLVLRWSISEILKYKGLNEVYHGIGSVNDLIGNFNIKSDEQLVTFIEYLNNIYAGNPYSYSSELSRKSTGMFRDIVTDNQFKANTGKWMIYGGLTHVDGGTKDTYYGKGYYTYDIGSSDMDADTKVTGAYMLGEYGISDTLTSGVVIGGNKLKSDLSNGSKVDGSALYLGAYAKKYIGNLKVTAGAGFQYGDYDADRLAVNRVASDSTESVMKYSDNYNDITYDIYLNGRYSHNIGENLFLEPYGTLSYTYIDQDGANEGSKTLAIETDSKSFDYTTAKVGVDLKKVIPHEKGKSTLSAGVSYTKILDGADEEHITGRFKGGSDFDILVAHKNEHSIGLNAKYVLELENGVLFDVKGTYSVERDSHNGSGKNRTKGEWIVGAGVGYKF